MWVNFKHCGRLNWIASISIISLFIIKIPNIHNKYHLHFTVIGENCCILESTSQSSLRFFLSGLFCHYAISNSNITNTHKYDSAVSSIGVCFPPQWLFRWHSGLNIRWIVCLSPEAINCVTMFWTKDLGDKRKFNNVCPILGDTLIGLSHTKNVVWFFMW